MKLIKQPCIIFCVVIICFCGLFFKGERVLEFKGEDGKVYMSIPVNENDEFSIGFVHSVNLSPVIDYYTINKNDIYASATLYYSFGAGVQTELEDYEKLEYTEDGGMLVSGIDKHMDNLSYVVGKVSDHTLEIHGESYSLRDICGRGSLVNISCRKRYRFPVFDQ